MVVVLVPRTETKRVELVLRGGETGPSEQLLAWAERFGLPGVGEWDGELEVFFRKREFESAEEELRERVRKRARVSEVTARAPRTH